MGSGPADRLGWGGSNHRPLACEARPGQSEAEAEAQQLSGFRRGRMERGREGVCRGLRAWATGGGQWPIRRVRGAVRIGDARRRGAGYRMARALASPRECPMRGTRARKDGRVGHASSFRRWRGRGPRPQPRPAPWCFTTRRDCLRVPAAGLAPKPAIQFPEPPRDGWARSRHSACRASATTIVTVRRRPKRIG